MIGGRVSKSSMSTTSRLSPHLIKHHQFISSFISLDTVLRISELEALLPMAAAHVVTKFAVIATSP
jgi:hypothetical protein